MIDDTEWRTFGEQEPKPGDWIDTPVCGVVEYVGREVVLDGYPTHDYAAIIDGELDAFSARGRWRPEQEPA